MQSTAAKPFVPICDSPTHHVAKHIVIEVQVEGDIVVEAYVLGIDRVTVDHARCKRDEPPVLTPEEEAYFVPHPSPEIAEILLRQLLKVQFRTFVNLEIQRKSLGNHRCHVVGDAHLERGARAVASNFLRNFLRVALLSAHFIYSSKLA